MAVVTGGGRGLGRLTARRFALLGARVVISDQHQYAGDETRRLITQSGGEAVAVRSDVSQTTDVSRLFEHARRWTTHLDILVNCADISSRRRPLTRCTASDFDRVMSVNVRGPFLATREFLKVLVNQGGGGRILTVASWAALEPAPDQSLLAASKGAVLALLRTAATEAAPEHVVVNTVCPRLEDGAEGAASGPEVEPASVKEIDVDWRELTSSEQASLGPLHSIAQVAGALAFLASDRAGALTGLVFDSDGARVP